MEIIVSPHKFYGNQELIAFIELFLNFILIMNETLIPHPYLLISTHNSLLCIPHFRQLKYVNIFHPKKYYKTYIGIKHINIQLGPHMPKIYIHACLNKAISNNHVLFISIYK